VRQSGHAEAASSGALSSTLFGVGLVVAAVGAEMKRTLIVLVVVGLCSPLWGQGLDLHEQHRLGAYLTFITITSKDIGKDTTPSEPKPGDVCPECNGLGKVGDGVTMLTCGACKGTGVVGMAPPAAMDEEPEFGGPDITDIKGIDWNWEGRSNPPVQTKRNHLIQVHGIDQDSVEKMTNQELEAIHNTLHNTESRSSCPDGNCPTSSSSGGCPSGNCPTSSKSSSARRYSLFGRRR
jgi:hypothetical protein